MLLPSCHSGSEDGSIKEQHLRDRDNFCFSTRCCPALRVVVSKMYPLGDAMARPRAKRPSRLHVGFRRVSQPGDLGEDLEACTAQGAQDRTCGYMGRKASLTSVHVDPACVYICVRCLHWGIYTGTLITAAQVFLFPRPPRGQCPCPVRGEGCAVTQPPLVGRGDPVAGQDLTGDCTYLHFISRNISSWKGPVRLVCATSTQPSLHPPLPPARLMLELPVLPGKRVKQSMGGGDANSSAVV